MPIVKIPITRYYGSKRKLVSKIWDELENLNLAFDSVLELFGGAASFSYYAKAKGKMVIYNDLFRFNYLIGKALIEADFNTLNEREIINLLNPQEGITYKSLIADNFSGIYYPDDENQLIDIAVQNIERLNNEISKASAYYVLFQTCLIKRPFNLFHRKNLSLRTNHVTSNFGNKKTWEQPFDMLFKKFFEQLTQYQFSNNRMNISVNFSALNCNFNADLVYIDPPYFGKKNGHISYHSRYHFLEGLANYNEFEQYISNQKAHREILINNNPEFEKKDCFVNNLSQLFEIHRESIIIISYRNGGYPKIDDLADLLHQYKNNVQIIDLGNYAYALNRNNENNREYVIIGF